MAAAYFDVDGTLARTNLLHPTLFYLARQQSPLQSLKRLGSAALRAPSLALAELRDRKLFNEELFALFEGMSEDRVRLLADEAFDSILRRALYSGARDLVERAAREGHEVVLVSGALDVLVSRLAAHLGASAWYANRLEFSGGRATGKLLPPVVAGPEKARLIREHAESRGYALGDCHAYADSASDVPMLSIVGKPAAVNPDARLARIAEGAGWPILRFEDDEVLGSATSHARRAIRAFRPSWERATEGGAS